MNDGYKSGLSGLNAGDKVLVLGHGIREIATIIRETANQFVLDNGKRYSKKTTWEVAAADWTAKTYIEMA